MTWLNINNFKSRLGSSNEIFCTSFFARWLVSFEVESFITSAHAITISSFSIRNALSVVTTSLNFMCISFFAVFIRDPQTNQNFLASECQWWTAIRMKQVGDPLPSQVGGSGGPSSQWFKQFWRWWSARSWQAWSSSLQWLVSCSCWWWQWSSQSGGVWFSQLSWENC